VVICSVTGFGPPFFPRIDTSFGLLLFGSGFSAKSREIGGGPVIALRSKCVQITVGNRITTAGMWRGDDHGRWVNESWDIVAVELFTTPSWQDH
jgi:hypothetical protein